MKRFNLLITPVGGIVVVVVMALSAVAGIVANFVSNQQSDLPAQTAGSVADFRRAAEQTAGNVGAAADIPPFELKPTEANQPDALIWWDATPEPVAMAPTPLPQPTATPVTVAVHQVAYVAPTPIPPRYQRAVIDGWVHIAVSGGWMPCHHLARFWNGDIQAIGHSPYRDWFNAQPLSERQTILSYCGG